MKTEVELAYAAGWFRAVWLYAVWRDGEQVVGVQERPLGEVQREGPDVEWKRMDLDEVRAEFEAEKAREASS